MRLLKFTSQTATKRRVAQQRGSFFMDPDQFLVGCACFQGSQCFPSLLVPTYWAMFKAVAFWWNTGLSQGTPKWASVFVLGFRLQNEKGTFAAFASTKGQAVVVSSNSSAPPKKLAALLFVCCFRVVGFLLFLLSV